MVGVWLISFLLLLFIEVITINLVTIWFALGSLAALITTILTDNVNIQVIVFIVVSAVSLIITKPLVAKLRKRKITPTNLDRVIGKEGVVIKDISKNSYGGVKVGGSVWTATSTKNIKKDSQVKVLKIDGVKLVVEKIEEEK